MTLNNLIGPERLDRILGPLAALDATLTVSLEERSGRVVAAVGAPIGARDHRRRIRRDISVDGELAGRLVVQGGPPTREIGATDGADDPTTLDRTMDALAESLGASLELILA